MSWLDNYSARLQATGTTSSENLSTYAKMNVIRTFKDPPSFKIVKVNSVLTDVRVIEGNDDVNKQTLFLPDTVIDKGSLVELGVNDVWLIVDSIQNDIYPKAKMQFCNSTLTIPGDITKTQVGTDLMGRAIWDETVSPSTTLSCIAESKVYMSQDQEPINLPNGRLIVTIPYTDNAKVKLNFKFDMYGNSYEVSHVDRSQVISTVGIIKLTADLVQGG